MTFLFSWFRKSFKEKFHNKTLWIQLSEIWLSYVFLTDIYRFNQVSTLMWFCKISVAFERDLYERKCGLLMPRVFSPHFVHAVITKAKYFYKS